MSKSHALTLRVKPSTLVGVYDIHELLGRSTVNKAVATVVSEALDALVDAMRSEETLPSYPDEETLAARFNELTEYHQLPSAPYGVVPRIGNDPVHLATPDAPGGRAPLQIVQPDDQATSLREQFADEAERIAAQVDDGVTIAGGSEIDGDFEPVVPGVSDPLTFEKLEVLAPRDKLVKVAKGDPIKERALAYAYSNITRDLWGSTVASELFIQTVEVMVNDAVEPSESGETNAS